MNPKRFKNTRFFCSSGAISACLIATFSLNSSVLAQPDVWYVDADVEECNNNGQSWPNAFKYLQDALGAADGDNFDQIWVAEGTYYVDQSCANEVGTADRTETFQLIKKVFLLGGFNGTELFDYERDPAEYETILSGIVADEDPGEDCATPGSISCFVDHAGTPSCDDAGCCQLVCEADPGCCVSDPGWDQICVDIARTLCGEAYHVVTAGSEIDDPEKTVIDGFTIRDGWANGDPNFDRDHGGGMFIEGEPSVVRCTVRQNTASSRGGGMSINGDRNQPDIINSIIEENPGDPAQPGDQQVFPLNGGGVSNYQADPMFVNCLFVTNIADHDGGAIHNDVGTCLNGPSGPQCGRVTLVNCTFDDNAADNVGTGWVGGGLYNSGTASRCDIDNSIFWINSPDEIAGQLGGSTVDYSDVKGISPIPGTGNIDLDPDYESAPSDLRLKLGSDAIDVGNTDTSVIPCDFFNLDNDIYACTLPDVEPTPDLDLHNRVLDGDLIGGSRVDMGAYEFDHPDACPWDIDGNGSVGATDLLALLVTWGPCDDCDDCPADFDGNCSVGATDLLALLVNWGPCPAYSEEPPTLREELADACLSPADWDAFVAMMTDPLSSEEDKERYNCWMIHHLFHCDDCSCSHLPECPSPDPFN